MRAIWAKPAWLPAQSISGFDQGGLQQAFQENADRLAVGRPQDQHISRPNQYVFGRDQADLRPISDLFSVQRKQGVLPVDVQVDAGCRQQGLRADFDEADRPE